MRCCLLGCQHTNDTYAVSRPKGPEPGINTHWGRSHQLKMFEIFLRSDLDLPANFLKGGGPIYQKFSELKNPNKINFFLGQIWTSQQISQWGGGSLSATHHRQTHTDNTSCLRATKNPCISRTPTFDVENWHKNSATCTRGFTARKSFVAFGDHGCRVKNQWFPLTLRRSNVCAIF